MSFAIGSQTIFGRDAANMTFNGTFTQVPNSSTSDLGINTPAGNYLVFQPIAGNSFTMTVNAGFSSGFRRARVSGLQVVEAQSVPEPSAVVSLTLGLAGLAFANRRTRRHHQRAQA